MKYVFMSKQEKFLDTFVTEGALNFLLFNIVFPKLVFSVIRLF